MNRGIYTYAWDLRDEGISTVVARLAESGLNTITLATSYHSGKFLRPHAPSRKLYFPEDGTIYFHHDQSRYGRIKPITNSMVADFDALRELEKQAPDFRRVGWTVCLHNTALGTRHPDLVARNVFGDPFYPGLCPSNPEVREYVVNLCTDMGDNYALDSLLLETPGWLPHNHGYHHEFTLIELNNRVESLLGLCFCDNCVDAVSKAGINIKAIKQNTQDTLNHFFLYGISGSKSSHTDWHSSDLTDDAEMNAFLEWRCQLVANLVAEVRHELNSSVELGVIPTVQSPNSLCWREGSDLRKLAGAADFLEVPAYQTGPKAIAEDSISVRQLAGTDARVNFILRPSYPNLLNVEELNEAILALQNAGMESLYFYNYGHLRLSALDWIKTALGRLRKPN